MNKQQHHTFNNKEKEERRQSRAKTFQQDSFTLIIDDSGVYLSFCASLIAEKWIRFKLCIELKMERKMNEWEQSEKMPLGCFSSALFFSSLFLLLNVCCCCLNCCYCSFWVYKKGWSFCVFGFVKEGRCFTEFLVLFLGWLRASRSWLCVGVVLLFRFMKKVEFFFFLRFWVCERKGETFCVCCNGFWLVVVLSYFLL